MRCDGRSASAGCRTCAVDMGTLQPRPGPSVAHPCPRPGVLCPSASSRKPRGSPSQRPAFSEYPRADGRSGLRQPGRGGGSPVHPAWPPADITAVLLCAKRCRQASYQLPKLPQLPVMDSEVQTSQRAAASSLAIPRASPQLFAACCPFSRVSPAPTAPCPWNSATALCCSGGAVTRAWAWARPPGRRWGGRTGAQRTARVGGEEGSLQGTG